MEEKKIIVGKPDNKIPNMIGCIFSIGAVAMFIMIIYATFVEHDNGSQFIYAAIMIPCLVVAVLFFMFFNGCQITVTNKRIYGTAALRKRVDLPLDSVSAVGTSMFKGIQVATSSGRLSFCFMLNNELLHKEISRLLLERQGKDSLRVQTASPIINQAALSNADELKKYKDLLDQNIITEEEFNAKKKQLLGL